VSVQRNAGYDIKQSFSYLRLSILASGKLVTNSLCILGGHEVSNRLPILTTNCQIPH